MVKRKEVNIMFEKYSIEWYLMQELKENYKILGENAYKENEFKIKSAVWDGIITPAEAVAFYRMNDKFARA